MPDSRRSASIYPASRPSLERPSGDLYDDARAVRELLAAGIQLGIEYDPPPPYTAGNPTSAGPELAEIARGVIRQSLQEPIPAPPGADARTRR